MATKRLQMLQNIATPLPAVTTEDNNKVLTVVDGRWKAQKLPSYEGEYEVTPSVDAQTINTAATYMESDLTIKAIPYSEVSNNSGGLTVNIGD